MKTKVFYLATKVTVAVILVAILVIEAAASGTPKIKVVPYAPERALIALENENEVISDLSIEDAAGNWNINFIAHPIFGLACNCVECVVISK